MLLLCAVGHAGLPNGVMLVQGCASFCSRPAAQVCPVRAQSPAGLQRALCPPGRHPFSACPLNQDRWLFPPAHNTPQPPQCLLPRNPIFGCGDRSGSDNTDVAHAAPCCQKAETGIDGPCMRSALQRPRIYLLSRQRSAVQLFRSIWATFAQAWAAERAWKAHTFPTERAEAEVPSQTLHSNHRSSLHLSHHAWPAWPAVVGM